jgi:hypothetical protein
LFVLFDLSLSTDNLFDFLAKQKRIEDCSRKDDFLEEVKVLALMYPKLNFRVNPGRKKIHTL